MKRVLLFGASGFVGPYLAKEFIETGYEVYGSDLMRGKRLPSSVIFHTANILDANNIYSISKSWEEPQETISVNVVGTLNILEAAKSLPHIPKILLIGSSEEYDISNTAISESTILKANNPYGISKVAQEQFANIYRIQYGMQIYYARSFNHTGVGQPPSFVLSSFCKQAAQIQKSGRPGIIKTGNLLIKRDFGHVKDLVNAYRLIIESPYCDTVYNIGTGVPHSLREMLNYIISLCDQPIQIEIDKKRIRPIDNPIICCDSNKIQQELGWRPRHSVFDALKEMFDDYLTQD